MEMFPTIKFVLYSFRINFPENWFFCVRLGVAAFNPLFRPQVDKKTITFLHYFQFHSIDYKLCSRIFAKQFFLSRQYICISYEYSPLTVMTSLSFVCEFFYNISQFDKLIDKQSILDWRPTMNGASNWTVILWIDWF